MYFTWALAITGLFLVFLEFFIPSFVMAIGGGVLLLTSLIFFYLENPSFLSLLVYAASLVLSTFLVVRVALWKVKNSEKAKMEEEKFQALDSKPVTLPVPERENSQEP